MKASRLRIPSYQKQGYQGQDASADKHFHDNDEMIEHPDGFDGGAISHASEDNHDEEDELQPQQRLTSQWSQILLGLECYLSFLVLRDPRPAPPPDRNLDLDCSAA
ncbi:hypothetical protein JCM10908_005695 [Rhodotorula pacifica]|uniref:uncharacterized protein n=1 Tax=Rhodotorula pacifica TaxID=1495444 RepID=UPI003175B119